MSALFAELAARRRAEVWANVKLPTRSSDGRRLRPGTLAAEDARRACSAAA